MRCGASVSFCHYAVRVLFRCWQTCIPRVMDASNQLSNVPKDSVYFDWNAHFFFVRSDVCCGCWMKCEQKRLYVWSKEKTSKKRSTVWGWRLGLARSRWGNLQPLQLAVYEQGGPFGVSSDVFEICKASISVATFGLPRLICGMVPRCNPSSSLLSIL